jgi:hypothetical protein
MGTVDGSTENSGAKCAAPRASRMQNDVRCSAYFADARLALRFGTSRFLSAAEILESDLSERYWEFGGVSSNEFAPPPSLFGNVPSTAALTILDSDMPQYITDDTDNEFTRVAFLRAYLASKGDSTSEVDLLSGTHFRTLPRSTADGSTSYWSGYRDDAHSDLDTNFVFPQAQNRPEGIKNREAIPLDTGGSNGTTQTSESNPNINLY